MAELLYLKLSESCLAEKEKGRGRDLPQQVKSRQKIIPGRCCMIHPPGMIRIKKGVRMAN